MLCNQQTIVGLQAVLLLLLTLTLNLLCPQIDFVHFRNLMLEASPGCKKAEDAWADKPVVYTRPLVPQPQFVSFGPSYK